MTVSTTSIKNSYSGNGSTTAFAYTFKAFVSSEIKVFIRTDSTGSEAQRSEGSGSTNYSVSGVGNAGGGTVTFVTAPASGETVVIRRQTAQTQGTDYVENDPFPAEDHETALDKLTHIVQEVQEEVDRSFKVSKTNSITTPEFTDDASTRASKLLGFSSDGNSLEATTGRVNTVSVSAVSAGGTPTVSFNDTTGALALGVVTGNTGATGSTGAAGSDGVFSAIASQAEAEGGSENTKGMTALRVKQAVDSYGLLASNNLSDVTASTARTNLGLVIGTDVAAHNADSLFADVSDNLTAGFSSDFESIGNSGTGTQTLEISSAKENLKTLTINGSFTLAPQTVNSVIALIATNDGTGGYTITTSGYDLVSGTYNNAASAKHLFRSTVIDSTQVLEILEIA